MIMNVNCNSFYVFCYRQGEKTSDCCAFVVIKFVIVGFDAGRMIDYIILERMEQFIGFRIADIQNRNHQIC